MPEDCQLVAKIERAGFRGPKALLLAEKMCPGFTSKRYENALLEIAQLQREESAA